MRFKRDKTEMTVSGAKEEQLKVSTQLQSIMLKTTDQARNLSVVMDSDMNFNSHIKTIIKLAFNHLKNISRIKRLMSQQDLEKLVHAFILVDSTTVMVSQASLTNTKRVDHITSVLRSLHWLPVSQRIDFKILLLVYRALNGLGPLYITDLLQNYRPDPSDHLEQVYCVSLEQELNMVKQRLVSMHQIFGTNSL